jgi:uncharacterized protein
VRTVTELAIAVVKGMRLAHPESAFVGEHGIAEDRRFFVVAANGRQYGAPLGPLTAVIPAVEDGRLRLRFPDGRDVEGPIEPGDGVTGRVTWDHNRPVPGRRLDGPFSDALSDYLGERVVLVEATDLRRGIDVTPVTLLGEGSVARLERELGTALGARRFRMTVTLGGTEPHEEDTWYGRALEIGGCRVRVSGPVPRCVATTHDPRTGARDHATLRGIVSYRDPIEAPDGELVKAPFGVYATVERPGTVRVGDAARLA